jgi:hypothetical protein
MLATPAAVAQLLDPPDPTVERVVRGRPWFRGHYAERYCKEPGFRCIYVARVDVYTLREVERRGVARWVRRGKPVREYAVVDAETREVLRWSAARPAWDDDWPDPQEQLLVRTINRMNIRMPIASVIAVPHVLQGRSVMEFSPFPLDLADLLPTRPPKGLEDGTLARTGRLVIWDPTRVAWGAYEAGRLVRWGPGAGGDDYCKDVRRPCRTLEGVFRVTFEGDADYKSDRYPIGECQGKKKDRPGCSPMPYFMRFHWSGFGLHGSPYVPGHNASHGCVRLFVEDARWLNEVFVDAEVRGPDGEVLTPGTPVWVMPYPPKKRR